MNILTSLHRTFLAGILCYAIAAPLGAQEAGFGSRAAKIGGVTAPIARGAIGVGSWNTAVEFKDIVVMSDGGEVLYRSDAAFAQEGTNGLTILNGAWDITDGVLRQSAIAPQCRVLFGDRNWSNYTVSLRARSIRGPEGFSVYFNAQDGNNWTWFNFAGWTNTLASIDQQEHGGAWKRLCERVPSAIETNVWYDVRVVLNGPHISCYVDSKLVLTTTPPTLSSVEIVASGDTASEPPKRERKDGLFRVLNPTFSGAVGVGTWNTSAEFKNIVVTSNNVVLYQSDFEKESLDSWRTIGGEWAITNGMLRQTGYELGCFANVGDTNWSNYTLTLQARKLSGAEGFCALVGAFGDNNRVWFNAGSWGNTSVEIYQDTVGRRGSLTERIPLRVETGRWYDVRIEVQGGRVTCYLDSELIHSAIANVLVSTNAVYLGSMPAADPPRWKLAALSRSRVPHSRGSRRMLPLPTRISSCCSIPHRT